MTTSSLAPILLELLDLPEPERPPTLAARRAQDPELDAQLDLLADYASAGDRFEWVGRAEGVLEGLDRGGVALYGGGALRALHLLVDLGVWGRHENVWLHRYQVQTTFAPELERAASALAQARWEPEPWRRDLTGRTCLSVDAPGSLDLDDALSCRPLVDGGFEVGVHIADPGARVPLGSALEQEARARGASIYLPTGDVPMLPGPLAEGALSLRQGQLRPALTTLVRLDRALNVVDVELAPSVVRVDHRLSYAQVDAILAGELDSPVRGALRDLWYLASEFYHQRINRGAVNFDLPEADLTVEFDEQGRPHVEIETIDTQAPARTLVSETMILVGAQVAQFCLAHDLPVIYRGQDPPEGGLIDDEILEYPEGLARTFATLRWMQRGVMRAQPAPHFGLGLEAYVQATSPIRRYSDWVCQRQVEALLTGQQLPHSAEDIERMASHLDAAARDASRIERGTRRYWTLHYLRERRGQRFEAEVLERRDPHIAYVFVHDVAFRARCRTLRSAWPGETLEVVVDRVDPRCDRLEMRQV